MAKRRKYVLTPCLKGEISAFIWTLVQSTHKVTKFVINCFPLHFLLSLSASGAAPKLRTDQVEHCLEGRVAKKLLRSNASLDDRSTLIVPVQGLQVLLSTFEIARNKLTPHPDEEAMKYVCSFSRSGSFGTSG